MILIPVSNSLPRIQEFLAARDGAPIQNYADERNTSGMVVEALRIGELLILYAVGIAGRPCRN